MESNRVIKYAEENWARAMFESLQRDADEAKEIALSANNKASGTPPCIQESVLEEIKVRLNTWDKWWKGFAVVLFMGLIAAMGFAWKVDDRAADVENGMSDVQDTVGAITVKMESVADTQEQLTKALDQQKAAKVGDSKTLRRDMKRAVIEALEERDNPKGSGRRHR